ncbi:hypothetical protein DWW20_18550 [Ruminococcus sp. AF14-5]|nr:hypothetical protein DWW20_18550 [Ruminococcus sp. AF14-5]
MICRWEEKENESSRQNILSCLFFCVKNHDCLDGETKISYAHLLFFANYQMAKSLPHKKHKNVIF